MSDKQVEGKEQKVAEVRERLQALTRKKKNGFLTPERKKKLIQLVRNHAAKEIQREQERKAKLRREIIEKRCGQPKPQKGLGDTELRALCQEYQDRIIVMESQVYDLEKEVEFKDFQINQLDFAVNDLKGKFIKPSLKRTSKNENKYANLQKKAAEFNFRNRLKTVKKKEFSIDSGSHGDSDHKKPDWALESGRPKSICSELNLEQEQDN